METHDASLAALQERLGYRFRDPALLRHALTHTSYLQDHPEAAPGNQRMEFLGDSVLQLILSEALYALFPESREGALSKRRSTLTQGRLLSCMAQEELGLDGVLLLSQSEEQTGGRRRPSILEDAFEAVVGAVYLDSDYPTARQTVLRWYGSIRARLDALLGEDNPKGRLQELVQPEHGNRAIRYAVVRTKGEPHEREYEVNVYLFDRLLGSGHGSSKKRAEEEAARAALTTLAAEPARPA